LQRILKKLNRIVCNRLKYRTIESKRVANYIINNYNKINVKKFKNTIAFIKQKLLKIKKKIIFKNII